jgi:hypothetical protein
MVRYWVGADFGQARDRSAIAVVERVEVEMEDEEPIEKVHLIESSGMTRSAKYWEKPTEWHYHFRAVERPPLGISYRRVAAGIAKRLAELEPVGAFNERGKVGLCIDAGGVGRGVLGPVAEEIRKQHEQDQGSPQVTLVPAQTTAGSRVTKSGIFYNIPKKDLVSAALLPMEEKRLFIAEGAKDREALIDELLSYRAKINKDTGHETFEAGGGAHDDLVFALCLAMRSWTRYKPPPRMRIYDYGAV